MAVILVVEDEEQVRVLAESFLQAEGNKTLSAATIEQAIALIEGEEPVDLLFVDLKIQDDLEGGLKLAKKAVEARPKLKVLYTSGQAVTDGMTALFVKQSAFLPKPYRAACHDTPRQIRDRQSLKVKFGRAMWPNTSQIEIWPWQPCPLLAQSGHRLVHCTCPLSGIKRT
jgi:DNA-binding NtrC family response regulator